MQPNFPLYIVSKGRWESRLTSKALERMRVPYHVIVEEQEFEQYAAVIDRSKLLVLDKAFQRDYDTFDDQGAELGKGSGPARNFAWAHAVSQGAAWHWVMDDNIRDFYRLNRNLLIRVYDGVFFRAMEDFVLRYENVGMAGPHYKMFAPRNYKHPPFITNSRVYSCNLIRCDLPYRWRGRYNEDTDLSLRMLKDGWATILFYAFLQDKMRTQTVKGGNTDTIYKNGTLAKSQMLVRMHPDVTRLTWKYGRWHHEVDYRPFRRNVLRLREGVTVPEGVDEFGMVVEKVTK